MAHDGTGAGWDITDPANDEAFSLGAKEIRDLRIGVGIRVDKEHVALATASVGGEHKMGSAVIYRQSADPTQKPDEATALDSDDEGRLFLDTDDGELHIYTGSAWSTIQFPAGNLASDAVETLKIKDANVTAAKLSIDADVAWGSNKITGLADGTTSGDALHYGQVDDTTIVMNGSNQIAVKDAGIGVTQVSGVLGTWDAGPFTNGSSYLAATDGFVVAYSQTAVCTITGYTDSANPPTTTVITNGASTAAVVSITFPVKKGDYWKVVLTVGVPTIKWIPIGS